MIVVVIVFAITITNVWSVMRLNSTSEINFSLADVECLANGEDSSGYKNARNQFCEKPKKDVLMIRKSVHAHILFFV